MTAPSKYPPWQVSAEDFPSDFPIQHQLKFLLQYAVLAPSTKNTQPWRFSIGENTIGVFADLTRCQPVADRWASRALHQPGLRARKPPRRQRTVRRSAMRCATSRSRRMRSSLQSSTFIRVAPPSAIALASLSQASLLATPSTDRIAMSRWRRKCASRLLHCCGAWGCEWI